MVARVLAERVRHPQELLLLDPAADGYATDTLRKVFATFGLRTTMSSGSGTIQAMQVYLAKAQKMIVEQPAYEHWEHKAAVIQKSHGCIASMVACKSGKHAHLVGAQGECECDGSSGSDSD